MKRSGFGSPALFDYIKHRLMAKPEKGKMRRGSFGGVVFALKGDELFFDIPMKDWDTDAIAKDLAAARQAELKEFEDTRY